MPSENLRDDDEINLLDLFVVLLKYRRLIAGISLGALLIAAVGYFWYPNRQYQQALEERKASAYLSVGFGPVVNSLEVEYDLVQLFEQTPLVLDALRTAGYERFDCDHDLVLHLDSEAERSRVLFALQKRFINNQDLDGDALSEDRRLYSVEEKSNGVEIWFRDQDESKAENFLHALYEEADLSLTESLRPLLEAEIRSYEELLETGELSEELQVSMTERRRTYIQAKQILRGDANVLLQLGEIYALSPEISPDSYRSKYKVTAIVVVMAALFIAVFLAFLLNAVSNIRSDEESMRKIREALKKK